MAENKNHYINNKEFSAAMTDWVKEFKECKESNKETPQITDYCAECFFAIATRYARKPKFSNYAYKDDMISEAVQTCIRYAHNFDGTKTKYPNAFSYFTQYCHNAFLQYIKKENSFVIFKFNLVKDAAPKLGKNDYRDIMIDDEDNVGLNDIEQVEEDMLKLQMVPVAEIIKDEGLFIANNGQVINEKI